jgi:hypothetical protein
MTDNELKFKVLDMAMDVARENMFAKRQTVENRWQHAPGSPYPDLPTIDMNDVFHAYNFMMDAISK